MTRPSPIDHDTFIDCESLDALQRLYAASEETFDKREAFLERAQQDWREVAFAKAKEFAEPPDALPAEVVEVDGIRYHVYGVVHGLVGGSDREYKDFVESTLGALDHTLFENGLHHFYPAKEYRVIPDYQVMGVPGSLGIGFEVGRLFPRLLWEGLSELLKLGRRSEGFEEYDYSKVFHAVPGETRRGLEEWPPLPSRLQIEYEMAEFGRTLSRLRNPYLICPRSLYMAGFARGFASSRQLTDVNLVVGDLHTMEIKRFLEGSYADHPIFRAAEAFGRRGDGSYRFAFLRAKLVHLALAGFSGSMVLLPVILGVYFGVNYLLANAGG